MEENTIPQDVPVADATPVTPPVTNDEPVSESPTEVAPTQSVEAPEAPAAVEPVEEEDDSFDYPSFQLPEASQLDLSNLPQAEDGMIDPNVLAGAINQQVATAEERAFIRAQQAFQEQQAETRSWDKAFEKYPELKSNKELRELVHNTRLGEVANMLSKSQDPRAVKLPTPAQIADRFFKHIGTAKQEGMKQATENTVIQASAHVETSGRTNNDASDARGKAFQNINNPNKAIARQARNELLKSMVFGE